nr:LOW QUALITY PROTEIN: mediator of RNA polymerase II transcription subunit 20 [Macaca nemestrina]
MPVAEGKSVQQTVELLTRKLEMLGAEKQGTFCVDCETYHTAASTLGSQGQPGKLMYPLSTNSEYPLSFSSLSLESGPCHIIARTPNYCMWEVGSGKLGSKQAESFIRKGGLLEKGKDSQGRQVEYGPCVVASDCWSLLLEFLQSFLGSHTPGAPAVFGNRHDAVYGPADTMVQYMELFNKIRKQQQVPVAGIR